MFKHVPWGSNEGNETQAKHDENGGESLTTILDTHQRGELTILIASATAAMRRTIELNFDASVSCAEKSKSNIWLTALGNASRQARSCSFGRRKDNERRH